MRKYSRQVILVSGVVALLSADSWSWGMERDRISFCSYAPPAALVITDSLGHRSGVDLSKPLSRYGRGDEISEIPQADVDQQNIGNDNPSSTDWMPTAWNVTVYDAGDQSYTVELTGVSMGAVDLDLSAGRPRELMVRPFITKVFVEKGLTRKLRVVFAPSRNYELTVERIVTKDDLSCDIGIACKLGLIDPGGICRSLEAKADAIAKAMEESNKKGAEGVIGAFANELSAQAGKKHIKEPALTILREEAESLLKTVSGGTQARATDQQEKSGLIPTQQGKKWWWPF